MLSLSLVLFACLDPYEDEDVVVPGPTPVELGPDGGTVTFGDLILEVPAGALPDPVEIRIYDTFEPVPADYDGLTTIWSLEPHGLVFNEPVTVSIPYGPADANAALYWSNDDGGYDRVTAAREDGFMVAEIQHFSTAFVADPGVSIVEVGDFQALYPPADVLFIVDNSCSMFEEQEQLAENIPAFIDPLFATGLDVHVGVVSTDMSDTANHAGKLQIAGGVSYIDSVTPDPNQVFAQMALLGTNGDFEEKGRAAAYTMVELKRDIPRNEGFYRDEATLSFIFVSDEEDQSGSTPVSRQEFREWMETLKSQPTDVVAHGFFFLQGTNCPAGDTVGAEYQRYVDWTGGVAWSMCASDWTPGLLEMIQPMLDSARVELPEAPDPSSVHAFLDGSELDTTEFRLEGSVVYFDQGTRPLAGQGVRVEYLPL